MGRILLLALFIGFGTGEVLAAQRTQFWNLTANTIVKLYLAPAGTDKYGPDQCKNDKDGTVDHDERLRITGVDAGRYDLRFEDAKKRVCVVRNVEVKPGDVFTVEEKDLKDCRQ